MIKIYKLTQAETDYIEPLEQNCQAAAVGFQEACRFRKVTGTEFWRALEKILADHHPGESIKGAKFDHNKMELMFHVEDDKDWN